jgi:Ran GTPase-activating protein (RanGAP) involved in mRNA processing and transport
MYVYSVFYYHQTTIGDDGIMALVSALQGNIVLKHLDLSHNQIGNTGAVALATILQHMTLLLEVDMMSNNIGIVGIKAIMTALNNNMSSLLSLSLGDNTFRTNGIIAITSGLQNNQTIQLLDLRSTHMNSDGAKAIATILHNSISLHELNLCNNSIGNE